MPTISRRLPLRYEETPAQATNLATGAFGFVARHFLVVSIDDGLIELNLPQLKGYEQLSWTSMAFRTLPAMYIDAGLIVFVAYSETLEQALAAVAIFEPWYVYSCAASQQRFKTVQRMGSTYSRFYAVPINRNKSAMWS